MPNWSRRAWRQRWLRFIAVGVLNTGFGYAVYAAWLWLGLEFQWAYLLALMLGVVFSFRTHGALVFRQLGWRRFAPYAACWAGLYFVNVLAIALLQRVEVDNYTAGALTALPSAVLSYWLQRFVVFRQ
jgi:putative flippase GtrA